MCSLETADLHAASRCREAHLASDHQPRARDQRQPIFKAAHRVSSPTSQLALPLSAHQKATNTGIAHFKSDVEILPRVVDGNRKRVTRSLRQRNDDEVATFKKYGDEERNSVVLEKLSDVVAKVDDVVRPAVKSTSNWLTAMAKNLMEFVSKALVTKLSALDIYKRVNLNIMRLPVLKQMTKIEASRVDDIANRLKGNKKTLDGMRRKITPFDGMKVPSEKFLGSHVGRDLQRYDKKDGSRLLSSVVVSRPTEQGEGQVLLISSSNPKKGDWLLPKGGWDKGENIKKAALREVIEEGGVGGRLAYGLGKVKFSEGKSKYTYFAYMMKGGTVFDDWFESIRYRLWVSYDEAIELLPNRPQMVEVVKRAKIMDEKVKAGVMPELNPSLAKIKLY